MEDSPSTSSSAEPHARRTGEQGLVWTVVQHVAYEGPGSIAAAAERAGVSLDVVRCDLGDALPRADDVDGLIVLGGPMGAHDDAEHPHLAAERQLLADCAGRGTPVLGVCLGAQLLAAALGARVFRGPHPEIGVGSVRLTPDGQRDPVLGAGGRDLPVLHWHEDTFSLPDGSVPLARTQNYLQAFRAGRAYGLQFHVELGPDQASVLRSHLPPGTHVGERHLALIASRGDSVLDRFFDASLRPDQDRD